MNFVIPCFIMLTSASIFGTGSSVAVNSNKIIHIEKMIGRKATELQFAKTYSIEVAETPEVIKEKMRKECQ